MVRARLLVASVAAAISDGDLTAAHAQLPSALGAARDTGDAWALAWGLMLSTLANRDIANPGANARLLADCDEGVRHSRAARDTWLEVGRTGMRAAVLAIGGKITEAATTARHAERMAGRTGSPRGAALAACVLGLCRYARGDLVGAGELFHQARRQSQLVEPVGLTGQVLTATDRHDRGQSRALLVELFELWSTRLGRSPGHAERALEAFVYFAASIDEFETIVRVCSTLAHQEEPVGIRDIWRQLAQAREALGEGRRAPPGLRVSCKQSRRCAAGRGRSALEPKSWARKRQHLGKPDKVHAPERRLARTA